MKVNMTPNPLDVVTIHASQGDTEARQWGFELHNNGELIDTSDVKEQLFFKAYKGGTEQILPENTSTPTTSPFKGDIRYPQGLLTDQEFTYRQSPTEEDGLAKITGIKGNTLVWNQLIKNGNFESTSGWSPNIQANTVTASSNELTVNINTLGINVGVYSTRLLHNRIANHKYLFKLDVYVSHATTVRFGAENEIQRNITTGWNTVYGIVQSSITSKVTVCYITATDALGFASGETYKIKNYQCFDFTQMGLDSITDPADFTSLFPLSYYSYNQGSLLSFNGNGIKTVGKNLLEPPTSGSVNGVTFTVNNDGSITVNGTATSNGTYDFYRSTTALPSWAKVGETYTLSLTNPINRFSIHSYDSSGTVTALVDTSTASRAFTIPNDAVGLLIRIFVTSGVTYDVTIYPQIEIGTSATSYEPYTSHTTNLPVSTYFPSGMKSAKNAYDELSPTKASVRIGSITFNGSEEWIKSTSYQGNYYARGVLHDAKYPGPNAISNSLILVYNTTQLSENDLCFMFDGEVGSYNVNIKNTSMTTVDQFKAWLQANPVTIYYELVNPTETSFSTASLVTENAEIPLSNNDGTLIGKCTEQLSENPGFIDAKIKLTDSDGTCYSNKLQLHVERKPS